MNLVAGRRVPYTGEMHRFFGLAALNLRMTSFLKSARAGLYMFRVQIDDVYRVVDLFRR